MIYLSRKGHFAAAHFLPGYKGKCSNLHGHNWSYEVVVSGTPDRTGMVIDFHRINGAIDKYDHSFLNVLLPFSPTCELMSYQIALDILGLTSNIEEVTVTLEESPRSRSRITLNRGDFVDTQVFLETHHRNAKADVKTIIDKLG